MLELSEEYDHNIANYVEAATLAPLPAQPGPAFFFGGGDASGATASHRLRG